MESVGEGAVSNGARVTAPPLAMDAIARNAECRAWVSPDHIPSKGVHVDSPAPRAVLGGRVVATGATRRSALDGRAKAQGATLEWRKTRTIESVEQRPALLIPHVPDDDRKAVAGRRAGNPTGSDRGRTA